MKIQGRYILDDKGRTLMLKGVNLGGSSKIPFTEDGSFTGRPFPPEEAAGHFERLSRRGLTFLRLVVTWEAIEGQGPGIYDEAYLAYLRKLLLEAEKWGISVFIDPHQDVWSRWTGGDGAPLWTLEKLGMIPENFDATGAAMSKPASMMWAANYNRYAAATLFTLFWGGKTFAPDTHIEDENVQDWLQEHYIAAFRHCFRRLKGCRAIAGWGIMNEPHYGFIGHGDLGAVERPVIPLGVQPNPFQAMSAASGFTVKVPVYGIGFPGYRISGHKVFNPERLSIFTKGFSCPWKTAGVWAIENDRPKLVKPGYFSRVQGKPADFYEDFYKPFARSFIERMREVNEASLFFIEGIPNGKHPSWGAGDPGNTVNAFHKYDGFTLFTKTFRPWFNVDVGRIRPIFGRKNIAVFFKNTLAEDLRWTRENMEDMPCLLGEFGVPFDLNGRRSFKTGNYAAQEEALSMYYDAIDANLLHSTLWNYTADNTNAQGDRWNSEDLSIFSQGEERAMAGWLRPYAPATAGTPLSLSWDRKRGLFRYRYFSAADIADPTEIFAPPELFGKTPQIEIEAAQALRHEYRPAENRLYVWSKGYGGEVEVRVKRG
ncbi:MAG: cellulase family glycosylhydrolase [Treponema sp.]|jgi:hypothetical protein|nr:cellulase family glycosylhydrolase [Treponema sp.]